MWDGAYVLGSLSPVERREFEAHLDGCTTCSRAVRDLAGLPGLLGRIGPDVFDESAPEPVPQTLLPRLSRAVRRRQQRRTWLTAGIAAAAAVVVTTGGVLALDRHDSTQVATPPLISASPTPTVEEQLVHKPRDTDPMVASVALTKVGWGTKLELTCSYPRSALSYEGGSYVLVVHTTDGRAEKVATWNGLPGQTMHVDGATAAWLDDITSVEVRHTDGPSVAAVRL
jgi:hypothetical protein